MCAPAFHFAQIAFFPDISTMNPFAFTIILLIVATISGANMSKSSSVSRKEMGSQLEQRNREESFDERAPGADSVSMQQEDKVRGKDGEAERRPNTDKDNLKYRRLDKEDKEKFRAEEEYIQGEIKLNTDKDNTKSAASRNIKATEDKENSDADEEYIQGETKRKEDEQQYKRWRSLSWKEYIEAVERDYPGGGQIARWEYDAKKFLEADSHNNFQTDREHLLSDYYSNIYRVDNEIFQEEASKLQIKIRQYTHSSIKEAFETIELPKNVKLLRSYIKNIYLWKRNLSDLHNKLILNFFDTFNFSKDLDVKSENTEWIDATFDFYDKNIVSFMEPRFVDLLKPLHEIYGLYLKYLQSIYRASDFHQSTWNVMVRLSGSLNPVSYGGSDSRTLIPFICGVFCILASSMTGAYC